MRNINRHPGHTGGTYEYVHDPLISGNRSSGEMGRIDEPEHSEHSRGSRGLGNHMVRHTEIIAEEYFDFLDRAHYQLADNGRDAGLDTSMDLYNAGHEVVMPLWRGMFRASAGMARLLIGRI